MTGSTPSTTSSRRRRIAAALLIASGAVTAAGLGAAAPASASPQTWASIAFSPDSGDYGWATAFTTEGGTDSNALAGCRGYGGKQCQVMIAVENQCAAIASVGEQEAGTIVTAIGQGSTLKEAEQNAVGFDGTLITAHCSSDPQAFGGGKGPAPTPPPHSIPLPVTKVPPTARR